MSEENGQDPQQPVADDAADDDRFTVLEVFGLKLEVSNPRLADLLTLDANQPLGPEAERLSSPEAVKQRREEIEQAAPDVMIAPQTPHDEKHTERRRMMRDEASRLGEGMGFTTHVDGVWESPTGVVILTRVVERDVSFAGASHFVEEIADRRSSLAGDDATVLFLVPDQQTADVFKVAIRQSRLYHLMRTVSLENLEAMTGLFTAGRIEHNQAVVLLAPVADIDVGEMLSVIRSAQEPAAE